MSSPVPTKNNLEKSKPQTLTDQPVLSFVYEMLGQIKNKQTNNQKKHNQKNPNKNWEVGGEKSTTGFGNGLLLD